MCLITYHENGALYNQGRDPGHNELETIVFSFIFFMHFEIDIGSKIYFIHAQYIIVDKNE